jgi:hypothetical protein
VTPALDHNATGLAAIVFDPEDNEKVEAYLADQETQGACGSTHSMPS